MPFLTVKGFAESCLKGGIFPASIQMGNIPKAAHAENRLSLTAFLCSQGSYRRGCCTGMMAIKSWGKHSSGGTEAHIPTRSDRKRQWFPVGLLRPVQLSLPDIAVLRQYPVKSLGHMTVCLLPHSPPHNLCFIPFLCLKIADIRCPVLGQPIPGNRLFSTLIRSLNLGWELLQPVTNQRTLFMPLQGRLRRIPRSAQRRYIKVIYFCFSSLSARSSTSLQPFSVRESLS